LTSSPAAVVPMTVGRVVEVSTRIVHPLGRVGSSTQGPPGPSVIE